MINNQNKALFIILADQNRVEHQNKAKFRKFS